MRPVKMGMTALALALSGAALGVAWAGEEPAPRSASAAAPPPVYYPPTAAAAAPVAIEALPLAVNREAAPRQEAASAPALSAPAAQAPFEAARVEPVKVDAPRPEAAKAEPLKAETLRPAVARTDTPAAESARAEPPKAEPVKANPRKAAALDVEEQEGAATRPAPATTAPPGRRARKNAAPANVRRQQLAQQAPPLLPIARCHGLCGRFILIGVGF